MCNATQVERKVQELYGLVWAIPHGEVMGRYVDRLAHQVEVFDFDNKVERLTSLEVVQEAATVAGFYGYTQVYGTLRSLMEVLS